MDDWSDCQRNLGLSFNDKALLQQAFAHSSYLNENPSFSLPSNERLEFLGDAVLDLIVTERLYREFPNLPEGELTSIRASLVCHETLAEIASSLKLGNYLLLGCGEEISEGRKRQSNLADVTEALIGALYLDQGMEKTSEFVLENLKPFWERIKRGEVSLNYKALLQELSQAEKQTTPVYRLVETTGPDHDKRFTVEVMIASEILGVGTGKNKKFAEIEAAKLAWEKLRSSNG